MLHHSPALTHILHVLMLTLESELSRGGWSMRSYRLELLRENVGTLRALKSSGALAKLVRGGWVMPHHSPALAHILHSLTLTLGS